MARAAREVAQSANTLEALASARSLPVGRPSTLDLAAGLFRHPAGVVAVTFAVVALALTLYLIQVSQVATLGYQLSQAQARELELRVEAETLRTLVAEYERPARIEAVARDQLGLVPAQRTIYLTIDHPSDSGQAAKSITNRWWAAFSAGGHGQ